MLSLWQKQWVEKTIKEQIIVRFVMGVEPGSLNISILYADLFAGEIDWKQSADGDLHAWILRCDTDISPGSPGQQFCECWLEQRPQLINPPLDLKIWLKLISHTRVYPVWYLVSEKGEYCYVSVHAIKVEHRSTDFTNSCLHMLKLNLCFIMEC